MAHPPVDLFSLKRTPYASELRRCGTGITYAVLQNEANFAQTPQATAHAPGEPTEAQPYWTVNCRAARTPGN